LQRRGTQETKGLAGPLGGEYILQKSSFERAERGKRAQLSWEKVKQLRNPAMKARRGPKEMPKKINPKKSNQNNFLLGGISAFPLEFELTTYRKN